jgi:hypothetical protein
MLHAESFGRASRRPDEDCVESKVWMENELIRHAGRESSD